MQLFMHLGTYIYLTAFHDAYDETQKILLLLVEEKQIKKFTAFKTSVSLFILHVYGVASLEIIRVSCMHHLSVKFI